MTKRPNEQDNTIRKLLKLWGIAEANRLAYSRGDRSTHALAQAVDMAPGTAEKARKRLMDRDGSSRRIFMASKTGVPGLRMIPKWACDPVPARNDADRPHDNPEIAVDMGIPEHLRWVDSLVRVLERTRPMTGACVREEYTTAGSQAVKCRRVRERLGYDGSFTVWMYRRELERAEVWIEGFAAAA